MGKMLVLAAVAASLSACVTVLQPPGSEVLGERSVDFRTDHDVISVGNQQGFFRSLNFQVERNDVEIFNIVVVYGNGEREKIDTRLVFREGSRSRVVDLPGGHRKIKSIEFTCRTAGERREGKARVVVFGMR